MRESNQPPQLNKAQANTFERAQEACENANYDYAVSLLIHLMRELPQFIEARRLLRAVEIARFNEHRPVVNAIKIAHFVLRGKTALKQSPQNALALAEEILAIDPTNQQGNELLAEAAIEAKMPETEILAYETIHEARPLDAGNLKKLAQAYLKIGEREKAQSAYEAAIKIQPHDAETREGARNTSALIALEQTVSQEEEKAEKAAPQPTPRQAKPVQPPVQTPPKAKQPPKVERQQTDSQPTQSPPVLEAQEKASPARSAEPAKPQPSLLQQIHQLYNQFNPNRPDPVLAKQIAGLYLQNNDRSSALEWFQYVFELTGKKDPVVEKQILQLKLQNFDDQLKEKEEKESTPSGNANASQTEEPEKTEEDLAKERLELLLTTTRGRMKRYPGDPQIRFEYGEALVQAGKYREAVPELQRALRHPYVRHRAYNLLGLCYWHRNMLDLAHRQYETALGEMREMNDLKKELTYNFARLLEQMEEKEQALDEYKKIYEIDSEYFDVAEKVESSYEPPAESLFRRIPLIPKLMSRSRTSAPVSSEN